MTYLIVFAYENRFRAGQVLEEIQRLQDLGFIKLEDAGFVTRNHRGEVELHSVPNRTIEWGVQHGLVGMVAGTFFLVPGLGLVIGASVGVLAGTLAKIGLDQQQMRELGNTLNRNASALFLLVQEYIPDQVMKEIQPYGGRLMHTTLAKQDAQQLRHKLQVQPVAR